MKLKKHPKNIVDVDSWFKACPPKKGEKQWADNRSAKELAKYMTKEFPFVPKEIEKSISLFADKDFEFDWDAEYVTALPGVGEGRNHDAVLFGENIVITIEAKADETLGRLIEEELKQASDNKLFRINQLLDHLYIHSCDYQKLRYQLLTASVGTILEAKKRECATAVLLVAVFKKNGHVSKEKLVANDEDIKAFLNATQAHLVEGENGLYKIPNKTNIALYFKKIVI